MPDEVIKQFHSAHQSILETIDQINLSIRSYREAKPAVMELQEKLLAHLGKQNDAFFYPLSKFYVNDRPSAKMLEFLQYDRRDMQVKLLVFFDRYSAEAGEARARSFPRDFTEFSKVLIGRIQVEKDFLLPLLTGFNPWKKGGE